MHILLVLAHPLAESFAAAVAGTARETLEEAGHTVDVLDLYRENFDPRLTAAERAGYFDIPYDSSEVANLVARLKAAEGLILVFPQWWFNFPAILKGFFDRVLAPGVAFSHDASGGRILPAAEQHQIALGPDDDGVTLVDRPALHGQSRYGVSCDARLATLCAKQLNFRMLSLHDMDRATDAARRRHLERVRKALRAI